MELEACASAAIASGYEQLFALGGDGTFQHLVAAALGSEVTVGLLPAGGGNDVARALRMPRDPIAAARELLQGNVRAMDVLRARFSDGHARIYVGGGGSGLDAESALLAAGPFRRLPGAVRYVSAALWSLLSYRPLDAEVTLDGQTIPQSDRLLIAAVSNTPTYGAGVRIAPNARPDDGLLDLVLVREMPLVRLIEAIPAILRDGAIGWPEIRRFQGRRASIRSATPAAFHGDGELLGTTPVEIEVLPQAIRVITPNRS
jgi:diacylglycerol kinase (ATP)